MRQHDGDLERIGSKLHRSPCALFVVASSLAVFGCDSRARKPEASTDPSLASAPSAFVPAATASVSASGPGASHVPCSNPRKTPRIATKDGKVELFVSPIPGTRYLTGRGEDDLEDLCIVRDGGPPKVIVAGTELGPDGTFVGAMSAFADFVLSPDESVLFFTTSLATHTAFAYTLDLTTAKVAFLFDGTVEAAIVRGPYAGHYLASHTRLDREHPASSKAYRGRITTWSVVTKTGKTLRALGDTAARAVAKSDTATPVPIDAPGRD